MLSYSRLNVFNRCPQKWKYRYEDNIPEPTSSKAFEYGKFIHSLLEVWFKGIQEGLCEDDIRDRVLTKLDDYIAENPSVEELEISDEIFGVIVHYMDTYSSDIKDMKVLEVEKYFSVPILSPEGEPTGHYIQGYIDAVLDNGDGTVTLVEHKTTSMSTERRNEGLTLDRQISVYWWAMEQMGYKVSGVLYNTIRKKVPTVPKELKKGGLSKAKDIDTTLEVYLDTIIMKGLDTTDYVDILQILEEKGNKFFRRDLVYRNEVELEYIRNDIFHRLIQMMVTRDSGMIYRNMCNDCNSDCQFHDLCIAEVRGEKLTPEIEAKYFGNKSK